MYLESKPRFEILDGLRGVAALVVVLYHMMECYPAEYVNLFFAHGYLAVDFFFALSGFVIGYAYDDRWNRMSTLDFFKRRITRLHPMVIFGVLVGVCFFYYSGSVDVFNKVDTAPWWMVLAEALILMCMIPLPSSMDIRGWGELNSLDGPIWTLMFEYVANIFYALFLRRTGKVVLGFLLVCCAVLTTDCCLHLNLWGLLDDENTYSVIGGFVLDPKNLYVGYTRLLYPFLAGLLLSRLGKSIRIQGGFTVSALLVLVMLAVPVIGGDHNLMDGIYQLVCILLVFPIILAIGAGSDLKGKVTSKVCIFLGRISFPLYISHYPLIMMHTSWAQRHADAPLSTHILVGMGTLVVAVWIAWSALNLYDEPVRAWLKEHWLKK